MNLKILGLILVGGTLALAGLIARAVREVRQNEKENRKEGIGESPNGYHPH